MKVVLYMAITVNGLIAGQNDEVSWVSKNSWKGYQQLVKDSDFVIVGKRTYEIMPIEEFDKNCVYYVFSHSIFPKKVPNIEFFSGSPKTLIEKLKRHGAKQVSVAGGGKLNASFMAQCLVDELFLDVMPVALGKGIPLFNGENFEAKLKLLEVKKLSANELQLHYKVVK